MKLIKDSGKDSLKHRDDNGISSKEAIGGRVHAHELDVGVKVEEDYTMSDKGNYTT